ncbi:hypothetical protein [Bowmanella sp. JS7-9]|uniref:Gustatory receptor n=1 Tax=Pseudobowmanella zhangzhouensis TaxID=1537679 RepID=A0ABW1XLI9_9ALTE|nr:hypothetical protein [Bowmanella sp. JS7-9]TBX25710.1 hypothetical protein TK45_03195 [Bowmanella sp. JS7-9]
MLITWHYKIKRKIQWQMGLAIAFIALFLMTNWLLGLLAFNSVPYDSVQAKDAGAALAFPIISGFMIFSFQFCLRSLANSISLLSHTKVRKQKIEYRLWLFFEQKIKRNIPQLLTLSAFLTSSYLIANGLVFSNDNEGGIEVLRLYLFVQCFFFWLMLCTLIYTLYFSTRTLLHYINFRVRIRLFQLEMLTPALKTGWINFVVTSLVISLQPLFWIHSSPPNIDMFFIIFALISSLFFFGYPVININRTMSNKKSMAVQRINSAIDEALHSGPKQYRRLVDNDQKLQYVSDLLTVRQEILETKTWLLDFPFMIRIGLLIFIPAFSWIASSIIDNLVKSFL